MDAISPNRLKYLHVVNVNGDKTVCVSDNSEVEEKIEQLIERREGRHHCRSCDYSSPNRGHAKEHAELHIEGLSYSCQFCDKIFRLKHSLRCHVSSHHR